jgi:hypothetical protein
MIDKVQMDGWIVWWVDGWKGRWNCGWNYA